MNQVKTNNYLRKRLGTHEARITKLQVKLSAMESELKNSINCCKEMERLCGRLANKYKLHLRDLHRELVWRVD